MATEAFCFEDDYVLINVSSMDFLITKSACNELSTSVVLGNHFWGAKVASKTKVTPKNIFFVNASKNLALSLGTHQCFSLQSAGLPYEIRLKRSTKFATHLNST